MRGAADVAAARDAVGACCRERRNWQACRWRARSVPCEGVRADVLVGDRWCRQGRCVGGRQSVGRVATRHRSVPMSVVEGLACATAARRDLLHHMNSGRTDSTITDCGRVAGTTAHLW